MIAMALQASALPDWKRPSWGASLAAVSQQLGSQITFEAAPVKSDILGMDELARGKMSFREAPANAQFFFVRGGLSAITVKPQNPKSCSSLLGTMRVVYGAPLVDRPAAEAQIFLDAWDDPRTGDRVTIQGTDMQAPAPFCTVTFVPPRHDRFNQRSKP
jgi:hypothetical protein